MFDWVSSGGVLYVAQRAGQHSGAGDLFRASMVFTERENRSWGLFVWVPILTKSKKYTEEELRSQRRLLRLGVFDILKKASSGREDMREAMEDLNRLLTFSRDTNRSRYHRRYLLSGFVRYCDRHDRCL